MPGNIIRATAANFCASSTAALTIDPDIRPLTALGGAGGGRRHSGGTRIFPASWINANFDVWIGHREDVTAWELLAQCARFLSAHCGKARTRRSERADGRATSRRLTRRCWRPRAATGAGGTVRSTARPMTRSLRC